jgi:hypothetical protein
VCKEARELTEFEENKRKCHKCVNQKVIYAKCHHLLYDKLPTPPTVSIHLHPKIPNQKQIQTEEAQAGGVE